MSKTWNKNSAEQLLDELMAYTDSPDKFNRPFMLEGKALEKAYNNNLGLLALACELQYSIEEEAQKVYRFKRDKRGEVGHMLKHLRTVKDRYPNNRSYTNLHNQFLKNAFAVVLIVAESEDWNLPAQKGQNRVKINSVQCRDLLDFSAFGSEFEGKKLCDSFFYANDHVPHTDIFGSGCFSAENKVVTAAHVLEEAAKTGLAPDKLLFIRGHLVYGGNHSIWIEPDQLYRLKQDKILKDSQLIYGQKGDSAWVEVTPYYPDKHKYSASFAKPFTGQLKTNQTLYALGHGLGVPMKLSFDVKAGRREDPHWFNADMHVFPGNSGSPVFDAETQELTGIVSALHALDVEVTPRGCIDLTPNMRGTLSAVSSQIGPLAAIGAF